MLEELGRAAAPVLPGHDDAVRPGRAGGRVLAQVSRSCRRWPPVSSTAPSPSTKAGAGSLQHRRHRHPRRRRLGAERPQAAGAVLHRGRRDRRRRPPRLGDARPVRGAGGGRDLHPGRQRRRHTVPRQPRARRRVGSRCPHARRPRCHGRRHAGGGGHGRRGNGGDGARHHRRVRALFQSALEAALELRCACWAPSPRTARPAATPRPGPTAPTEARVASGTPAGTATARRRRSLPPVRTPPQAVRHSLAEMAGALERTGPSSTRPAPPSPSVTSVRPSPPPRPRRPPGRASG